MAGHAVLVGQIQRELGDIWSAVCRGAIANRRLARNRSKRLLDGREPGLTHDLHRTCEGI